MHQNCACKNTSRTRQLWCEPAPNGAAEKVSAFYVSERNTNKSCACICQWNISNQCRVYLTFCWNTFPRRQMICPGQSGCKHNNSSYFLYFSLVNIQLKAFCYYCLISEKSTRWPCQKFCAILCHVQAVKSPQALWPVHLCGLQNTCRCRCPARAVRALLPIKPKEMATSGSTREGTKKGSTNTGCSYWTLH